MLTHWDSAKNLWPLVLKQGRFDSRHVPQTIQKPSAPNHESMAARPAPVTKRGAKIFCHSVSARSKIAHLETVARDGEIRTGEKCVTRACVRWRKINHSRAWRCHRWSSSRASTTNFSPFAAKRVRSEAWRGAVRRPKAALA
jgi:hypothetical protein